MEELASYTYQSQTDFLEIMDMLDRRLNDKGKNWRHIAKSLTVLDYLVRYGSEKCVLWAKDNIYIVKTLREFIHYDDSNQDQGAIIRVKAKELVALLRDDERLAHERELANRSQNGSSDRRSRSRNNTRSDPYDSELQRALELSKRTAEEEARRGEDDSDDADLQAALKLSLEEEELRKQKLAENTNLLDINDEQPQPQYFMTTGMYDPNQLYQQQQLQQQQLQQQQLQQQQLQQQQLQQQYLQQQYLQQQAQQQAQQYDMFGNPVQFPLATGLYQQPAFTGFGQQPQQEQQPLKTGSNNPFAISSSDNKSSTNAQSLNSLAQQQAQAQPQQPQFFTQPTQSEPLKQQTTSGSKFNDSTHSELNNLLAQGTGIDTFGNTGATRIPHQHTQTQQFINSSGTGYVPQTNTVLVSSNATGNPFLNTGIGYQATKQQQQPQINPAYTGYGFGNAQPQQQRNGNEASLIDI
jgi:epsin